jgi:hypothetical protein
MTDPELHTHTHTHTNSMLSIEGTRDLLHTEYHTIEMF